MLYKDTLELLDEAKWYIENHLKEMYFYGPENYPLDYSNCVLVDMVVLDGDEDRVQVAVDIENGKLYSTMFHCELAYDQIKEHFDGKFNLERVIEYFKWFRDGKYGSASSWNEFDMKLLYAPIDGSDYELEVDRSIRVSDGGHEVLFNEKHGVINPRSRMNLQVEVSGLDYVDQNLSLLTYL
ncbi:hypothetical protein [Vibrio mediterranei]|uniref:hypothetical protein n=1 Tax=Vibrio mediterranei TaxID=689 RepID=UPI002283D79D|nr:hypothetical protein [Vibrio mediterranei]MCY9855904.1 hypothetical protein [Vibrio mediterranei]